MSYEVNTSELLHRLEDERPACRVCGNPCQPSKRHVTLLLVPTSEAALDPELGIVPVHTEGCLGQAEDMLARAKADRDRRTRALDPRLDAS